MVGYKKLDSNQRAKRYEIKKTNIICEYCGKAINPHDNICPHCGSPKIIKEEGENLSAGYQIAMFIFSALGGFIGFILVIGVFTARTPDNRKKYNKKSRKIALYALLVSTISFILFNLELSQLLCK